ncbi:MAG TPA: hypothetical protein P5519_00110 [Spirochaetia bacterium]|nr:hypothetical protein [Spirochaetales bacterium]HRS64276.1 hypothetical protein [Spirochaetia bacterium]HOT59531.1 hypothetical protein [Spirochaetales bacterium]HPD80091.1 hypothetical protein [Spirochaetales bacterium]HQG39307.1 hypothetical protein [Spirochaetales bacterium]
MSKSDKNNSKHEVVSDVFSKFSDDALLKQTDYPNKELSPADKAQLNRKGNIFYNEGKIELARRIYQTTGYSDGLIRIGEYYLQHEQPIEALKMFKLAHDDAKTQALAKIAAEAIKTLLKREDESNG